MTTSSSGANQIARGCDEVLDSWGGEVSFPTAEATSTHSARAASGEVIAKRDEFLSVASHELKTPLTTMELVVSAFLCAARAGRTEALGPEKGPGIEEADQPWIFERIERSAVLLHHGGLGGGLWGARISIELPLEGGGEGEAP